MDPISRILDKCTRSGAEMAEVYHLTQNALSLTVRDGKVETINRSTPGGIAIRYLSSGKSAFSHTTDDSDASIDMLISRLSRLVKKTDQQEAATLTGSQEYPQAPDIYDPSFIDTPAEHKIDYLVKLEELALRHDPLIAKSSGVSFSQFNSRLRLVNSKGMDLDYRSTLYNVEMAIIARKGEEMFPGESSYSARHFKDLPSPETMAGQTASKAARLVGGTAVDSGDYEIIFTPDGAFSLLWGLSYACKGDDYLKGASYLTGKEGARIAVDNFSLIDDALMARGVASRPADAEGIASRKTAVIENGIFKTALYDSQTAAKAKTSSTGSASRADYSSYPEISPSNFYIVPGKAKVDDVVASCRKGIIVEGTQGWGLHSVTGQYSAGINGVLVLQGKRIRPVANVTIAASAEQIFQGIAAICDDITFYRRSNSPTILVKKMKVAA